MPDRTNDRLEALESTVASLRGSITARDQEISILKQQQDTSANERQGLRDVEATTPSTADEEFEVTHTWGRKVDKVMMVKADNGTVLYQGPTANTKNKIYLKATKASDDIVIRPAE